MVICPTAEGCGLWAETKAVPRTGMGRWEAAPLCIYESVIGSYESVFQCSFGESGKFLLPLLAAGSLWNSRDTMCGIVEYEMFCNIAHCSLVAGAAYS